MSLTANASGTDFSGNFVAGPVDAIGNTGGFLFGDFAANTVLGPVTASGNV